MSISNITSPEDQSATFIELFFDLVFVFSVTQVVSLFHGHLDWTTVGQSVLIFWLVWWAWTQYTWALNAADTTHPLVEVGTLLATAVAFFMAVALPGAFGERALWFAVPYILVRVIGLSLYVLVTSDNPLQAAGVRRFALLSTGGLLAVLIGAAIGGPGQYVFWALAILLDVVAANYGGQSDGWNIHPEHFGERHGLFVIIALGETLIVAAGSVSGATPTTTLFMVAVMAVLITCGLWWSYFPRTKPILDTALETCLDSARTQMARDVFSLLHFPMILGVIAYAIALEEAAFHPDEPMSMAGRLALATGLTLFMGGMAGAVWRANRQVLVVRLIVLAVTATAIILITGLMPAITLGLAFIGVVVIVAWEQRVLSSSDEFHSQML